MNGPYMTATTACYADIMRFVFTRHTLVTDLSGYKSLYKNSGNTLV